ncbi:hypothetical protein IVB14_01120 [Bradyrhizobium sp. 180]|uniref:DUF6894 family protein n=1 Tax=unclassified Bradyrhizobium TaxID=2631580 RepID=UPI001FFA5D3F|nr:MULTISPECIES: hypothetical protein [unclassified Bradyrhizobium]MCK1489082.1 hypothetical protein [Bradyrhizobium sp. 180]MCK1542364.1 hypothetical protein [Bradyrhizobium sp. 179]
MALYFDTRDSDRFIRDEDGVEISSFAKVKLLASEAMADLAKDVLPGAETRNLAIEVRMTAARFLRLNLRFEVEQVSEPA